MYRVFQLPYECWTYKFVGNTTIQIWKNLVGPYIKNSHPRLFCKFMAKKRKLSPKRKKNTIEMTNNPDKEVVYIDSDDDSNEVEVIVTHADHKKNGNDCYKSKGRSFVC